MDAELKGELARLKSLDVFPRWTEDELRIALLNFQEDRKNEPGRVPREDRKNG